jgi:hypothetical protein
MENIKYIVHSFSSVPANEKNETRFEISDSDLIINCPTPLDRGQMYFSPFSYPRPIRSAGRIETAKKDEKKYKITGWTKRLI